MGSKNFKLSDSQVDKLKSVTQNTTGVTLTLSSDMIQTHKINFLYNLLLTNRQPQVFVKLLQVVHGRM